jgi:peptidyl-prolyl cis-trans isomerase D
MVDRKVADAAFDLKQGEVSAPIEGRFGIALVQVSAIEPAQTKPFDAVAEELKRDLALERARAEVQTLYDKIEDERLAGTTLEDAARSSNLKLRTIDAIDRTGRAPDSKPVPELPQGVDLLSAVFTADVHGDHDPLRMTGGTGYVWFDVVDITPSRERPLDEVKDQVEAGWREAEIATRLRAQATMMMEKLKAGTPFAEIAEADKLKVEWLPGVKRGQNSASLSPAAVDEVFRTAKDAAGTAPGATPTSRVVFRVTEIKVPPLDPKSAEAKPTEETLSRAIAEDIVAQYITQLQSEVGVTINQSALNQITGGGTLN